MLYAQHQEEHPYENYTDQGTFLEAVKDDNRTKSSVTFGLIVVGWPET